MDSCVLDGACICYLFFKYQEQSRCVRRIAPANQTNWNLSATSTAILTADAIALNQRPAAL